MVAIKVLLPKAAAVVVAQQKHEQFVGVGSFFKELEVLSKFRHQNIVWLLGSCLSEDAAARQCLVFEWMAGGSLLSRLAAGAAPLSAADRFAIASDVARGLEYLHNTADPPIIHQDVKSDNILLDVVGGTLLAKVADFGTARFVPELLDGGTHHSTGMVIGTKPYQPAEYIMHGQVSEKTDTFAFGVVLCELLTGEPPKDRESGEMLAAKMLEPLADSEHALPRLLDKRLGAGEAWPLGRAIRLGCVAARCIEVMPEARCIVADVLPELTAIAGRKAIRRAGRGKKYDPMTGELVQIAAQLCTLLILFNINCKPTWFN
jgi:serine/threonine protein kinase